MTSFRDASSFIDISKHFIFLSRLNRAKTIFELINGRTNERRWSLEVKTKTMSTMTTMMMMMSRCILSRSDWIESKHLIDFLSFPCRSCVHTSQHGEKFDLFYFFDGSRARTHGRPTNNHREAERGRVCGPNERRGDTHIDNVHLGETAKQVVHINKQMIRMHS